MDRLRMSAFDPVGQYSLFGRIGDTADYECISFSSVVEPDRTNGDPLI
jgi:hypothetical protein